MNRVLIALAGAPLLLIALFWSGGQPFTFACLLIGLVGAVEITLAVKATGRSVHIGWPLAGVSLLVLTSAWEIPSPYRMLTLVFFFLIALAVEAISSEPKPLQKLSLYLFLTAYPGLIFVAVLMRQLDGIASIGGEIEVEQGALWVCLALFFVWFTDTGAYIIGRSFGRHPLAPRLSPNKTWEGALGGWVFAAALGTGVASWNPGALFDSALSGLCLGALIGIWAQVGDLAESAIKRELGVKDFGGWLPGHGGALDRFDSFLFVAPLVYLWALISTM